MENQAVKPPMILIVERDPLFADRHVRDFGSKRLPMFLGEKTEVGLEATQAMTFDLIVLILWSRCSKPRTMPVFCEEKTPQRAASAILGRGFRNELDRATESGGRRVLFAKTISAGGFPGLGGQGLVFTAFGDCENRSTQGALCETTGSG